jgi:hypothetical protein
MSLKVLNFNLLNQITPPTTLIVEPATEGVL